MWYAHQHTDGGTVNIGAQPADAGNYNSPLWSGITMRMADFYPDRLAFIFSGQPAILGLG